MKSEVKLKYDSSPKRTVYLKFYIYGILLIRLFLSIGNLGEKIGLSQKSDLPGAESYYRLLAVGIFVFIVLTLCTFIQIKNLTESGYILFWVLEIGLLVFNIASKIIGYAYIAEIYQVKMSVLLQSENTAVEMIGTILGGLIWIVPHAVYFKKRKYLFYGYNTHFGKPLPTQIEYCNQCGSRLPFIGEYCNQCGSKRVTALDVDKEPQKEQQI